MSYDVYFYEGDKLVEFDRPVNIRGGTYCYGGTRFAWLNITYNYASFFLEYIDPEKGIRSLYGKTAKEVIEVLDEVIPHMSGEPEDDYWMGTEGNAKDALCNLRLLACLCPEDAILKGN